MNDALPLPVHLVHYDAPEWLRSALDSIRRSDIPVAVTVIDNGPPGSLGALPAEVTVRRMPANGGYAGGANDALRQWLAGGMPFAVLGSHDLHVEPDSFSRLLAAARAAPEFGILGPEIDTNFQAPLLGRRVDVDERTMVSGTCLFLRRACIADIGLFDPLFRSYAEDNELCARAIRHGWRVGTVPGARASGLGTRDPRQRALGKQKNRLLLAYRVGGPSGAAREYGRAARHLGHAVVRDRTHFAAAVAALTVGTVRLARGVASPPPRVSGTDDERARPRGPRRGRAAPRDEVGG